MTEPLPERFEGRDLVLRRWLPSDVAVISAAVTRNLEHLRPWMPWIAAEPIGEAARLELVQGWERAWAEGGDVVLGAFRDGEVVGGTGLHRRLGPHGLEIGYWVDGGRTGCGIGTEMARVLTTAALRVPGVDVVEIHHDRANVASRRIPEKLGYTFVGEAPDKVTAPAEDGVDCTWRMHAADWRDGA